MNFKNIILFLLIFNFNLTLSQDTKSNSEKFNETGNEIEESQFDNSWDVRFRNDAVMCNGRIQIFIDYLIMMKVNQVVIFSCCKESGMLVMLLSIITPHTTRGVDKDMYILSSI